MRKPSTIQFLGILAGGAVFLGVIAAVVFKPTVSAMFGVPQSLPASLVPLARDTPALSVPPGASVEPARLSTERLPEIVTKWSEPVELAPAHSSVKRMSTEARLLADSHYGGRSNSGAQALVGYDSHSSAVSPLGTAPADASAKTIAAPAPRLAINPMQPNPALAAMTQTAQKDLTSMVEALRAAEVSLKR